MKRVLLNFFLGIVTILFSNCTDELVVNRNPAEIEKTNTTDVDDGVIYLNNRFFLKNTDNTTTIVTRSGDTSNLLTRSFIVSVNNSNTYFLGAHVLPTNISKNGKEILQDITVYVNGESVGTLELSKAEWEFVTIKKNNPISLQKGSNTVTFASEAPFYPEIDAIQVEKDINKLLKKDEQYDTYIDMLSAPKLANSKKLTLEEIEKNVLTKSNTQTRSAINPSNYSWQVTPKLFDNPEGNYSHRMNMPITYTYHRKISLVAGTYTFTTKPIEGDTDITVDPIMYLTKVDNPDNYYWFDDDRGDGWQAEIKATLPAGDYNLVVAAYLGITGPEGRQGLVDVYMNDIRINRSVPVAGHQIWFGGQNIGLTNYFTAYSTGIPEVYLLEYGPDRCRYYGSTFFYAEPMEHIWHNDARVRINSPIINAKSLLLTASGALGTYFGNCDVYMECYQVQAGDNVARAFPNLKVNDGIYSGNASTVYNCASWAGGITTGWAWGPIYNPNSTIAINYGSPTVWSTWDNFFGNNPARYAGATTYTRSGADSNNGEIAVWSTNGSISGVTHFSVRGTANNHPHGYAWESKAGSLNRFFHPRDAVRGSSYGNIFAYYRDVSKNPNEPIETRSSSIPESQLSFEESVTQGLTVIEKVELTPEQKAMFSATTRASGIDTNTIEKLYNSWITKLNTLDYLIISNPYELLNNQEANDLIKYGQTHKKDCIAFFVNKFFNEDNSVPKEVSYYLFCQVFKEHAQLIEKIKEEWKKNRYNEKGAYIAPLPETFTKKYIKELLGQIDKL